MNQESPCLQAGECQSTIQKQLKDEQPSAAMVFGLESVKDIDRLIISANTNFLNVCYISLYPPRPTLPTPPTLLSIIICSKDKLNWYNQVREEFRKNFHFPLVLWITDEISSKLIRSAPDFESWGTSIHFTSIKDRPSVA